MNQMDAESIRTRLVEKLADSLAGPIPLATTRHIRGTVSLPNKATAVIGMRRAGRTTFLHQLRRERLDAGVVRERLPYIYFEDEQLVGLTARKFEPLLGGILTSFPGASDEPDRHLVLR
jgi:hypothetical protein